MPMESLKNANPRAVSTTAPEIFEKSGLNKKASKSGMKDFTRGKSNDRF